MFLFNSYHLGYHFFLIISQCKSVRFQEPNLTGWNCWLTGFALGLHVDCSEKATRCMARSDYGTLPCYAHYGHNVPSSLPQQIVERNETGDLQSKLRLILSNQKGTFSLCHPLTNGNRHFSFLTIKSHGIFLFLTPASGSLISLLLITLISSGFPASLSLTSSQIVGSLLGLKMGVSRRRSWQQQAGWWSSGLVGCWRQQLSVGSLPVCHLLSALHFALCHEWARPVHSISGLHLSSVPTSPS